MLDMWSSRVAVVAASLVLLGGFSGCNDDPKQNANKIEHPAVTIEPRDTSAETETLKPVAPEKKDEITPYDNANAKARTNTEMNDKNLSLDANGSAKSELPPKGDARK